MCCADLFATAAGRAISPLACKKIRMKDCVLVGVTRSYLRNPIPMVSADHRAYLLMLTYVFLQGSADATPKHYSLPGSSVLGMYLAGRLQ